MSDSDMDIAGPDVPTFVYSPDGWIRNAESPLAGNDLTLAATEMESKPTRRLIILSE